MRGRKGSGTTSDWKAQGTRRNRPRKLLSILEESLVGRKQLCRRTSRGQQAILARETTGPEFSLAK